MSRPAEVWRPTDAQRDLFQEWKGFTIGHLVSCKEPITFGKLRGALLDTLDEDLPLEKMGFKSMYTFMTQLKNDVWFSKLPEGGTTVTVRETSVPESMKHIRQLVLGQASKKKKSRPVRRPFVPSVPRFGTSNAWNASQGNKNIFRQPQQGNARRPFQPSQPGKPVGPGTTRVLRTPFNNILKKPSIGPGTSQQQFGAQIRQPTTSNSRTWPTATSTPAQRFPNGIVKTPVKQQQPQIRPTLGSPARRMLNRALSTSVKSTSTVVKSSPSTPTPVKTNTVGTIKAVTTGVDVVDARRFNKRMSGEPIRVTAKNFSDKMDDLMDELFYEFRNTLPDLLRRAHEQMFKRITSRVNKWNEDKKLSSQTGKVEHYPKVSSREDQAGSTILQAEYRPEKTIKKEQVDSTKLSTEMLEFCPLFNKEQRSSTKVPADVLEFPIIKKEPTNLPKSVGAPDFVPVLQQGQLNSTAHSSSHVMPSTLEFENRSGSSASARAAATDNRENNQFPIYHGSSVDYDLKEGLYYFKRNNLSILPPMPGTKVRSYSDFKDQGYLTFPPYVKACSPDTDTGMHRMKIVMEWFFMRAQQKGQVQAE